MSISKCLFGGLERFTRQVLVDVGVHNVLEADSSLVVSYLLKK